MGIKEKSTLHVDGLDGTMIDHNLHDSNDAWEKGMNYLMRTGKGFKITETVTVEKE